MKDPFYKSLEVILEEVPDYEHYRTLSLWELFDAICLLLGLWPDKSMQRWWNYQRAEFKEIRDRAISDILSKKLKAKDLGDGGYLVESPRWIEWAKTNSYPLPKEFEPSTYAPGRELQKRRTRLETDEVIADAKIIKRQLTAERKPASKKSIVYELSKLPKYSSRKPDWLAGKFTLEKLS